MITKADLDDTIETLTDMLNEAQDNVERQATKMASVTDVVDDARDELADAEARLEYADEAHAVAFEHVEALCTAITMLRRQYVAMPPRRPIE